MSAWRIGTGSAGAARFEAAEDKTLPQQLVAGLGALVKWLPAEIVAGYAAAVTMMQPEQVEGAAAQPPDISWPTWIVALVATPVIVLVAAGAAKNFEKIVQRVFLSIPAFALWSASVPHSVWEKYDSFKENRPVFLFALLILTSIFTYVAQWLTRD